MWDLLEAVADIFASATLGSAMEEAPKWVRVGCTTFLLVPVLGLFGWAVWGLLT